VRFDGDGQQLERFEFSGTPASLAVNVARDGEEIFVKQITPDYRVHTGGGDECLKGDITIAR